MGVKQISGVRLWQTNNHTSGGCIQQPNNSGIGDNVIVDETGKGQKQTLEIVETFQTIRGEKPEF